MRFVTEIKGNVDISVYGAPYIANSITVEWELMLEERKYGIKSISCMPLRIIDSDIEHDESCTQLSHDYDINRFELEMEITDFSEGIFPKECIIDVENKIKFYI